MNNHEHPTLGKYTVGTVPGRFLSINGATGRGDREILVPQDFVKDVDFKRMNDPTGQCWSRVFASPMLEIIYADMLAAHPGAVIATGYGSHFTMPAGYGILDGVTSQFSNWDGITFTLGQSSYRVRKATDDADLRKRISSAMRSLAAAERKRIEALGQEKETSLRIDALAKWIIGNLRPHAADAVRAQLDEWSAMSPDEIAKKHYKPRLEIDCINIVGAPHDVKICLTRQNLLTASMSPAGGIKLTANGATTQQMPESVVSALAGRMATELVAHPALEGRRIKGAVTSTSRTHSNKSISYVQVSFEQKEPEPYDAAMVRTVPYAEGQAESMLAALMETRTADVFAQHRLNEMGVEKALAIVHPLANRNHSVRLENGDTYSLGGDQIRLRARLAPNVVWENCVICITQLPEVVMGTLRSKCMGRPVTSVVDHPALRSFKVKSTNIVAATKSCGETVPGYFAIRIEPISEALPLAA